MKSKRLLQIFLMLVLLIGPMGNVHSASASSTLDVPPDAMVINRTLNFWDATYVGYISSNVVEKWHFEFTESHSFMITVSPITGGLTPALSLLDAGGSTITSGVGTLTSTQPAGSYYILTYPDSGSGFYFLTIREIVNTEPSVSTSVDPEGINVGETALVTVSLNNVPLDGYTSAEFTCTYDPAYLSAGNIMVGSLFGADSALAVNDPQNGSFIVAIAGSNGERATTSGPVFTFNVTALQAGQTSLECSTRVSNGDGVLTSLSSTGSSITIGGAIPTVTSTPGPVESPTPTVNPSETVTATPDGSGTPTNTSTPDPNVTPVDTNTPAPTVETPTNTPEPTFTALPTDTPLPTFTATATPLPAGSLSGNVIAGKPVTVSLYDASDNLVATVSADIDGSFNLTAPAGTYTVVATAEGFLAAEGLAEIPSGGAAVMPDVTLIAGDVDGNGVIDEFDAMTIGMNYNADAPAAADLNNDGVINVLDLEILAANYRLAGPIAWE